MIVYNYSNIELVSINNTMSAFCNALWGIDFQLLFSQNREFLENILDKVGRVYYRRTYGKNFNLTIQDLKYPPHAHASEMQKIVKLLQEIFEYMHDISHGNKAGIATYEFKLTQKKLEELLSLMPSGNFSDDDVALVKYLGKEFVEELHFILPKIENQVVLDNIIRDMQMLLENPWFACQLVDSDLLPRLILTNEQINVLIKGLKLLPRYFEDWDVDMRIGGSFLEIDALLHKIESWQFGLKFNIISDDDLNIMYNVINELTYESSDVDYQSTFSCEKQFLEDLLSKIMIIMDNRIFFKKWGDYNPQESFSLDVNEIKVIVKILETKDQYFNDEEIHTKPSYSPSEIKEIKNKLETFIKEIPQLI